MSFDNVAKFLTSEPSPELKAWRYDLICRLIDAGMISHEEITQTVEQLYKLVTSGDKNKKEKSDNKTLINTKFAARQLNGANLLNKLILQADLKKNQLEDIEIYLDPSSINNLKKV